MLLYFSHLPLEKRQKVDLLLVFEIGPGVAVEFYVI